GPPGEPGPGPAVAPRPHQPRGQRQRPEFHRGGHTEEYCGDPGVLPDPYRGPGDQDTGQKIQPGDHHRSDEHSAQAPEGETPPRSPPVIPSGAPPGEPA